ncbi:hypothetical protein D3C78_1270060 [compost metagenome]
MTLLSIDIPRNNGAGHWLPVSDANGRQACLQFFGGHGFGANPRQVALHVGQKYRNADTRELLGHFLQRHGFTGPGCTGDQTMAVGQRGQDNQILFGFPVFHRFGNNPCFTHFLFLGR